MTLAFNRRGEELGNALVGLPSILLVFVIMLLLVIFTALFSRQPAQAISRECDTTKLDSQRAIPLGSEKIPLAAFLGSELFYRRPMTLEEGLSCYCNSLDSFTDPTLTQLIRDRWRALSDGGRYQFAVAYKHPKEQNYVLSVVSDSAIENSHEKFDTYFSQPSWSYSLCSFGVFVSSSIASQHGPGGREEEVQLRLYLKDTRPEVAP
jgi:hypothetical protein